MCFFFKQFLKAIMAMPLLLLNLKAQNTISTIAGTGISGYSGDSAQAIYAELGNGLSLSFNKVGNLYVGDENNNRIRKIDTNGIIYTVVGTGTAGFSGDNGQAINAEINAPQCLHIGKFNTLYFADGFNNRIRKIDTNGIINTIAGTGAAGYSGNGGQAINADINLPLGVITDDTGNIYFSDNNRVIWKIDTNGIITIIAGTGTSGYSGDNGPAVNAQFNAPRAICFDKKMNILISDLYRIRKIDTSGIITTIAGTGTSGYSGDNGLAINAELNAPGAIAVDDANNIYFVDEWNNVVRKIDANGIITTIVGTGTAGYNGDNILAINAQLNTPFALAFDKQGNLYIGDNGNNRIRKVSNVGVMNGIKQVADNKEQIIIYPNPNNGNFFVNCTNLKQVVMVELYNVLGQQILTKQINTEKIANIEITGLEQGAYTVKITNSGQLIKTEKVIVTK